MQKILVPARSGDKLQKRNLKLECLFTLYEIPNLTKIEINMCKNAIGNSDDIRSIQIAELKYFL